MPFFLIFAMLLGSVFGPDVDRVPPTSRRHVHSHCPHNLPECNWPGHQGDL